MPEYPDIEVYLDALRERLLDQSVRGLRIASPFVLRSVAPGPQDCVGHRVCAFQRLGKRVCIGLDNGIWLVIHLMVAGRLHWKSAGAKLARRNDLLALDVVDGTLVLTEAGTKKRASLHLVMGEKELAELDPGGIDFIGCGEAAFAQRLTANNHTLKRALTDPRLFSGIGNAYSDEILHHARLSPVALTQKLDDEEISRLYASTLQIMEQWRQRLGQERGAGFPGKVTAFRPEMAVHGKYGQSCPDCGTTVQRIVYASNETNYCPRCQTGGKILADRALSRLLKKDWPRSVEELESAGG